MLVGMATAQQSIPAPPQPVGLPDRDLSRSTAQSGSSPVSDNSTAQLIADDYRKGSRSLYGRRLTWEKYLRHIDGEGDGQWAEIQGNQRVAVPRTLAMSLRHQENLLRIVVAHMVAYHTTFPFRFQAESSGDRESKERSLFDSAFVNYCAAKNRWNAVFAEALYLANPAGFCPVHAFWRNDPGARPYEPIWNEAEGPGMQRGTIDSFAGDPWTMVFNSGAKLGSIHDAAYERVLPAELARSLFPEHKLEGNRRMASASRFQRIVRRWQGLDLDAHGTATMTGAQAEEHIAFICREWAPGVLPDWEAGRFMIVALVGASSADRSDGGIAGGRPVLVHDGPLPAGRFSFVNVYSHSAFDDVYGKPFVADLDDAQVYLNQYKSAVDEYFRRASRPTLATFGVANLDELRHWRPDNLADVDRDARAPQYIEQPGSHVAHLLACAELERQTIFRLGGYQAASRGEASSGDPGVKIQLLQQADKTIHGPTNARFREAVCSYAQLVQVNMKEFGDVPWPLDMMGADFADLGQDTISSADLSENPPQYSLVNMFGVTPEMASQELLQLVTTAGADRTPLLSTAAFRSRYPSPHLFSGEIDPLEVKRQRATGVNRQLRKACRAFAQQNGFDSAQAPPQWLQQAAAQVEAQLAQQYPPLPDDDVQAHYNALSEITQDLTEDPLAAAVAVLRQQRYQAIWAQQAAQQAAAAAAQAAQQQPGAQPQQPQQEAAQYE